MFKRFLLMLSFFALLLPSFVFAQETTTPEVPERIKPSFYTAKVLSYATTEVEGDPNATVDTIQVELEILSGKRKGEKVNALWSNNQQITRAFQVKEHDKLVIACTTVAENETCDIVEQQRSGALWLMLLIFLAVIWLVTNKKGLRAFATMIIGLVVILVVIIPLILKGWSPIVVTIIGGLAIVVPSIYLSHGFNMKSHITLFAIIGSAIAIGILAMMFTELLNLTGATSDETNYLKPSINLRSVLLSAILLGALGIIDDIAMTQVSIVNELYHSNNKLSGLALFKRAMHVGQDHIASVINTLFLAYAGVSLPLLILIQQNELPAFVAIQQEPIATEIMRTLVGTIGLILVVPLTTYIASQFITRFPDRFPAEAHHHIH